MICLIFPLLLFAASANQGVEERVVSEAEYPAYVWYNQAVAFQREGKDHEALKAYEEALNLKSDLAEAYLNAGVILQEQGLLQQALQLYERANETADNSVLRSNALNNIGHLRYHMAGSDFVSILSTLNDYQEAIAVDDRNVDAWYNLGKSLEHLGRREEAREAFETVLTLKHDHASAHLNLGNYFFHTNDGLAALQHHREVLRISGSTVLERKAALNNMGQLYRMRNMYTEAKRAFEQSLQQDPTDIMSRSNVMVVKRTLCDWETWEVNQDQILLTLESELSRKLPTPRPYRGLTPYDSTLVAHVSSALHLRLTKAHTKHLEDIQTCPLREAETYRPTLANKREPLRIGYLSFDFRDHPMGHLTHGIITHRHSYPRPSWRDISMEIIAASYGPNDNSTYRRKIEGGVDTFLDLEDLPEMDASCHTISDAGVHILVDLMALTRGTRLGLVALRPAPLVVNYLGYPSTAGGSFTDYVIMDTVVAPPETAKAFSEKIVYLPHVYQANTYSFNLPLPAEKGNGSGDSLMLCNLNNVDKIEPYVFDVWMGILRTMPHAKLALLSPEPPLDGPVISTLKLEASAHGVHPHRLEFWDRVSKEEHLVRLSKHCHLFLDTLVYGAHSTAADSLWAGVPLITVEGWGGKGDPLGKTPARVASSLLRSLGQKHTRTHSVKEFEDISISVGMADGILEFLRKELSKSLLDMPLFNVGQTSANLEKSYQAMWEVREASLPPQNLVIDPTQPKSFGASDIVGIVTDSIIQSLEAKDSDRALNITARGLRSFGNNADLWHLRGVALTSIGEHVDAVVHMEKAISLLPNILFFHTNLAEVYLKLKDFDGAIEYFRRALQIGTEDIGILARLLGLLNQQKRFEEVIDIMKGNVGVLVERWPQPDETCRAFENYGIALSSKAFHEEAVSVLEEAMRRCPQSYSLMLRLGSVLENSARYEESIVRMLEGVQLKNAVELEQTGRGFRRFPRPAGKEVVAIYCDEYGQSWWDKWGPSSIGKGLGGSEEAVIFMSRELADLGYFVEVYGNPSDEDIGPHQGEERIVWYPSSVYDAEGYPADIFIAWRYHISMALGLTSRHRYLWLQDVPSFETYTPRFLTNFVQAIFCLSAFHVALLPPHARHLGVVTPNGIDPSFLTEGPNLPGHFVYSSAPNRGLEVVLRLWPEIRRSLHAQSPSLHIYYGFTPAFEKYGRMTIPGFEQWRAEMLGLLKQEGIVYHGMVGHATLAKGLADAGFILYPTVYPETGCVTLMKAQAMGAIPITSRCLNSTLPELTEWFDLGPRPIRSATYTEDTEWMELWVQAVVAASNRDFEERRRNAGIRNEETLQVHRKTMIKKSRERFGWKHVAEIWRKTFQATGD